MSAGLFRALSVFWLMGMSSASRLNLYIDLHTFNNPNGEEFNAAYCDGLANACDPFFTFCIDSEYGNTEPHSCRYSRIRTASYLDLPGTVPLEFGSVLPGDIANPLVIPFNTWPGTVLFKIKVEDQSGVGTVNGLIDIIYDFIEAPLVIESESQWVNRSVLGTREVYDYQTTLNYSFAVFCDTDYYGPECNVFCVDTDGSDGHYTCHPETGDKICLPGWIDPSTNCTVNEDDCASEPCLNYGLCIDRVAGYECLCLQGITGDNCETNLDECASFPCQNGGTCVDLINDIQCECTSEYAGKFCESPVNKRKKDKDDIKA